MLNPFRGARGVPADLHTEPDSIPPTRSTAIVWVQHCRCTSALRGRLSPMGIPPARSWPGPGGTPVCPGGYWHRSACLRWKPRHSGDIPHPYFMASRGYIAVCTDTVCTLSIHTRSREENVPGTATQKQGCTVAAQGHTFRWGEGPFPGIQENTYIALCNGWPMHRVTAL